MEANSARIVRYKDSSSCGFFRWLIQECRLFVKWGLLCFHFARNPFYLIVGFMLSFFSKLTQFYSAMENYFWIWPRIPYIYYVGNSTWRICKQNLKKFKFYRSFTTQRTFSSYIYDICFLELEDCEILYIYWYFSTWLKYFWNIFILLVYLKIWFAMWY